MILYSLILALSLNPSVDDTRREEGKMPLQHLDSRERVSLRKSFVWDVEVKCAIPRDLVQVRVPRVSENSQDIISSLSFDEMTEVTEDAFLVKGLRGSLTISRTPQITAVYRTQELGGITKTSPDTFRIGKTDKIGSWAFYYLGDTGEVAISASDHLVTIMSFGKNGIGLPPPNQGPYVGQMCFLAGVSPFRLLDVELSDWQIISVDEEEWVFELTLTEKAKQRLSELEGTVSGVQQVRFSLNRKRGDALKELEIRGTDYAITYRALEYRSIDGVWFPSVVVMEESTGYTELYRLVAVSTIPNLTVDIPEGKPVRDYRQLRRGVFRALLSDTFDGTVYTATWSPRLLAEIWREVHAK